MAVTVSGNFQRVARTPAPATDETLENPPAETGALRLLLSSAVRTREVDDAVFRSSMLAMQCRCVHRGPWIPHRDSVKKFPVFSGLPVISHCKVLLQLELAAESSQERTYESLWRRVASPRLKSAIEGRKPNRSTGQFPAPDECRLSRDCSICIVRVGREIPCKAGVVLLLL